MRRGQPNPHGENEAEKERKMKSKMVGWGVRKDRGRGKGKRGRVDVISGQVLGGVPVGLANDPCATVYPLRVAQRKSKQPPPPFNEPSQISVRPS